MEGRADVAFRSYLSRERIEYAYGLAQKMQLEQQQGFADTGFRAAVARDHKLLIALERMAEETGAMQEEQIGRLMRDPGSTFGESRGTTEHQLCREAFRLADEGRPIRNFEWIYGAAAWLCGYSI
jgi:hypothetical protein